MGTSWCGEEEACNATAHRELFGGKERHQNNAVWMGLEDSQIVKISQTILKKKVKISRTILKKSKNISNK